MVSGEPKRNRSCSIYKKIIILKNEWRISEYNIPRTYYSSQTNA